MTRLRTLCPGPEKERESLKAHDVTHTPSWEPELGRRRGWEEETRDPERSLLQPCSCSSNMYTEDAKELQAGDILSNKMSQVTVLEEEERARAHCPSMKGTVGGPHCSSGRASWRR